MMELAQEIRSRVKVMPAQIADFCRRWSIIECALFGSVLRSDFHSDSDIDLLVTFSLERKFTLDDWLNIQEEANTLFKRKVDLVSKDHLRNPYRRQEILKTCQVIYVAES